AACMPVARMDVRRPDRSVRLSGARGRHPQLPGPSGRQPGPRGAAVITVKRLTLEDALVLLAAAETKAREIAVTETICVCDDGGHPIALHRMTGARITG